MADWKRVKRLQPYIRQKKPHYIMLIFWRLRAAWKITALTWYLQTRPLNWEAAEKVDITAYIWYNVIIQYRR